MSQDRLLFVVDSLDRFGATRQLNLLVDALCDDFDVHVATLHSYSSNSDSHTLPESCAVHRLEASSASKQSFRTLARSGLRLRKLIRRIEPNTVHAWCQPAERVMLAASVEFKSVTKFVTELYIRPSSNMTMEAMDRQLGKPVTKFIVPHEEVKKSLVSHQYDAERIEIIPNAIGPSSLDKDLARRKLVQLGGFGDHVHIAGAVAPLVPRSRLKDLIWATDLLTCVRDDVHFFIFGRGPQRKRLEKFASQTEAGHHVHFVDCEMHAFDLIPGLDFFWHSHLNEPLPSALHHAMLNEVPVVSVYGPGTQESLIHQETGFATNFGARDEFARWTKYLLERKESGRQLARQGNMSIKGKFELAKMVAGYNSVYQ